MIRRPPRSTHCISSAAPDVYKRQDERKRLAKSHLAGRHQAPVTPPTINPVSYTHLRAHETRRHL
eukprot:5062021-Prorocentrum_lima.AAC.1